MILMIAFTLFFAVPVAILVFALAPHEGRKLWFAHWTYAVGAIAGGLLIAAIAAAGRPILIPVYGAGARGMAKVLTKVAGPYAARLIVGLTAAALPLTLRYLGMAAGIWVVWWNRERGGNEATP
jgi:hypothetical protein